MWPLPLVQFSSWILDRPSTGSVWNLVFLSCSPLITYTWKPRKTLQISKIRRLEPTRTAGKAQWLGLFTFIVNVTLFYTNLSVWPYGGISTFDRDGPPCMTRHSLILYFENYSNDSYVVCSPCGFSSPKGGLPGEEGGGGVWTLLELIDAGLMHVYAPTSNEVHLCAIASGYNLSTERRRFIVKLFCILVCAQSSIVTKCMQMWLAKGLLQQWLLRRNRRGTWSTTKRLDDTYCPCVHISRSI